MSFTAHQVRQKYLDFFAKIYGMDRRTRKKRIDQVLSEVDLFDSKEKVVEHFSGGMKRRLGIAQALINEPKIIVVDEPTTGLDVISSRNIREFVMETVSKSGKTVLYTTHYIEEAAQICDRIGILNSGQIIACDTPDAIRNMIKKEEVIHLTLENVTQTQIERLNCVEGVISIIENKVDVLPGQKQLCLELKNVKQLPLVFDFLFKEKIKLVNFKREEPTLEDAFIQLTQMRA